MSHLGERIRKFRKENNLTQQQLADLLGVSRESISMYERGERTPRYEKLIKLAQLSKLSLDELFALEDYSGRDTPI